MTLKHLHDALRAGVLDLDQLQHSARLVILALYQLLEALGSGGDGGGVDDVAMDVVLVLHQAVHHDDSPREVHAQETLAMRNAHALVVHRIAQQQRDERVELREQPPATVRVRSQCRVRKGDMSETPKKLCHRQETDPRDADKELRVSVGCHSDNPGWVENET